MRQKIVILILLCICTLLKGEVKIINAGIGGNNSKQLLERVDKDVIAHQPDLCILMVGTNDMLNSRKMLGYETYSTNLSLLVSTIKEQGIEVLLMSSPPVDSAYLFTRHNRTLFKQSPNAIMDSVSTIVKNIAKEQGALFLDLHKKFASLKLPKHNEDLFIRNPQNSGAKDGVHPTPLGYHFIAENIFQLLKEKGMLKTFTNIVCFGDSITAGSGAKGHGTVKGENYPSYLYLKLLALGDQ